MGDGGDTGDGIEMLMLPGPQPGIAIWALGDGKHGDGFWVPVPIPRHTRITVGTLGTASNRVVPSVHSVPSDIEVHCKT